MQRKQLGKTGVFLAAIGLGTTQVGGEAESNPERDADRVALIRRAIDLGYQLIDTAALYGGGRAEMLVGRAVSGIRSQAFIASKFNPDHAAYALVKQSVEDSLKRLNTDYLDLLQVHWPSPLTPWEETLSAMLNLVQEGKVRFLGAGNTSIGELERSFPSQVVAIQEEYSLLQRHVELAHLPFCRRQGISLLAYSPLDQGRLFQDPARREMLEAMGRRYGRSAAQMGLRWLVQQDPVIVLVKAAQPKHLQENLETLDFSLSGDDERALDQAFAPRLLQVPPRDIELGAPGPKNPYRTVAEAMRNAQDLIPAPEWVAERIRRYGPLKPLGVVAVASETGPRRYVLADDARLLWAWAIARGLDEPMPVCVKWQQLQPGKTN